MTLSKIKKISDPSRRDLLRGGAALSLGATFPNVMSSLSTVSAAEPVNRHPERILVVVELDGGNDGLNTIVPYGDDAYYRNRPHIGLPEADLRKIDDHFGFHASLAGLERLYKDGKMAIVHGCGYDDPVLSHFASMGYWHTGVPHGGEKLGWVGRLADRLYPDAVENIIINIDTSQSLAVRSRVHAPLVFDDPDRFVRSANYQQSSIMNSLVGPTDSENHTLNFLSTIAKSAISSSARVRDAWTSYSTPVSYGLDLPLAIDLRKVAALIDADMPTRLYYVKYRGNAFDTHVHQVNTHARLLAYTGDALHGFMEDIARLGRADDVAMMVFTEFGRRVPENASKGTDHGTASPMFVFGNAIEGGLYGTPPSLTDLDNGNLIYTTDFRRVYATMISEWLGIEDSASVLGGTYAPLGIFDTSET